MICTVHELFCKVLTGYGFSYPEPNQSLYLPLVYNTKIEARKQYEIGPLAFLTFQTKTKQRAYGQKKCPICARSVDTY